MLNYTLNYLRLMPDTTSDEQKHLELIEPTTILLRHQTPVPGQ